MKKLTIGMATYDDFDGVFFSIQAIRLYQLTGFKNDVEFILIDGNPKSKHGESCKNFLNNVPDFQYIPLESPPSSFNKYKVIEFAKGKYTIILDCHVLLEKDAIKNLLLYFEDHPNCQDLIQGPLLYDNLKNVSTNFDRVWRGDMFGIWATNNQAMIDNKPFEISMQGMGLCAFETKNWPGINKNFRGFGGEEGYISEKFRQKGGKNICLPSLQWNHRFGRPNGVPYPLRLEDRVFNYFLGWMEILQDENHPTIQEIRNQFNPKLGEQKVQELFLESLNYI